MPGTRRAVIDIGTNSIKLMVADVSQHKVKKVWEEKEQTRLGKDLYETQRLQPDAIHATAYFAAKFAALAKEHGAEQLRVIATSATRDAKNRDELLLAIRQQSGLEVDVLSGEEEARLSFRGVTSHADLRDRRLCLVEVGGGSMQLTVGENDRVDFAQSYDLGSVRLSQMFPVSNPPQPGEEQRCREWLAAFIGTEVEPRIGVVLSAARADTILVGVGSTAKGLMRMESKLNDLQREELKANGIPLATVADWTRDMWHMSLSDRKRLIGIDIKRADTLPFGAAIIEEVMRQLGFPRLRVSKRGLRHGAVR